MSAHPSKENSEQLRWFAEKVEPHGPALRVYLRRSFPKERDLDDVVQESFLQVWKTRSASPVEYARALLFSVARHLAIDRARRRKVRREDPADILDQVQIVDEGPGAVELLTRGEKSRLLAQAIDDLPSRCREIVVMRKLYGIPGKDVAAKLGLSEKTVESHLTRGIKRCEHYMRKRGLHHLFQ